jgi:hypothetical protein
VRNFEFVAREWLKLQRGRRTLGSRMATYAGLVNYFESIRAAFDDRSFRRGVIVAEGNYIACRTWIEGRFVREFAHSPAGTLPPNDTRAHPLELAGCPIAPL